jgi:hypothetical protein
MKRYVFTVIAATLMFGAASAREVAFCDPSYDIQKVSGDKAVCVKEETFRDYIGNRNCPVGAYTGNENPADGGDLCNAPSGLLAGAGAVPAIMCEIDPAYVGRGAKTDMNKGSRDRCYINKQRPLFGNVRTKIE